MGRKTIKIDLVPYNFPTIFIGANTKSFYVDLISKLDFSKI